MSRQCLSLASKPPLRHCDPAAVAWTPATSTGETGGARKAGQLQLPLVSFKFAHLETLRAIAPAEPPYPVAVSPALQQYQREITEAVARRNKGQRIGASRAERVSFAIAELIAR
jgi:hypothetical protein